MANLLITLFEIFKDKLSNKSQKNKEIINLEKKVVKKDFFKELIQQIEQDPKLKEAFGEPASAEEIQKLKDLVKGFNLPDSFIKLLQFGNGSGKEPLYRDYRLLNIERIIVMHRENDRSGYPLYWLPILDPYLDEYRIYLDLKNGGSLIEPSSSEYIADNFDQMVAFMAEMFKRVRQKKAELKQAGEECDEDTFYDKHEEKIFDEVFKETIGKKLNSLHPQFVSIDWYDKNQWISQQALDAYSLDNDKKFMLGAGGRIACELGQPELAEKFLVKALAVDPDDPLASYYLGIALALQNKFDEAFDCLKRVTDFYAKTRFKIPDRTIAFYTQNREAKKLFDAPDTKINFYIVMRETMALMVMILLTLQQTGNNESSGRATENRDQLTDAVLKNLDLLAKEYAPALYQFQFEPFAQQLLKNKAPHAQKINQHLNDLIQKDALPVG